MAVVYLRIIRDSQTFVTLQLPKPREAPRKTISILRLELCAAQLLAQLTKHFIEVTPIEVSKVHLWLNSTDVLC